MTNNCKLNQRDYLDRLLAREKSRDMQKDKAEQYLPDNWFPNQTDETYDKDNDIKILNYTLVIRKHETELWNIGRKSLSQSYIDAHSDYRKYRQDQTKPYLKYFCPLYFFTFSIINNNEPTEHLVYIGKTNSKENRFSDGHKATQEFLRPFYNDKEKNLYFAQVWIRYEYSSMTYDVPLEWLYREELVNDIIKFLEYLFIYQEKAVINDLGKEVREKEMKFREWETYWPQCSENEEGFNIILDKGIKSQYFDELAQGLSNIIKADLNKEDIIKEIDNRTKVQRKD